MFRFPDVFKVGIAESGNHDQRENEDDWGERYQGLLVRNADGTDNYDAEANQNFANAAEGASAARARHDGHERAAVSDHADRGRADQGGQGLRPDHDPEREPRIRRRVELHDAASVGLLREVADRHGTGAAAMMRTSTSGGNPSDTAPFPRYVVDPRVSKFIVQAFSGGMLSALGHDPKFVARDFSGEVVFDANQPDSASMMLTIRPASFALMDDVSERDRATILRTMHDEVLESSTFTEIAYRCPKAKTRPLGPGQSEVTLDGELTLHGVTRRQAIAAKFNASGPTLRAFGEFTVRQSEYDIKPVTVAASMLKVKDELKCSFDIVAHRSP